MPRSRTMAPGAKILAAASVLCIILWAGFLVYGAHPLTTTNVFTVIYGEQEEFFADAVVYQKVRNGSSCILHLPRARPAYRWWTVDFQNMSISAVNEPRSLASRRYLLRGDGGGTRIDDHQLMGDWYWHFTETGAAFAGNGFTCRILKNRQ